MIPLVQSVTNFLSLGTLLGDLGIVVLLFIIFSVRRGGRPVSSGKYWHWFKNNALILAWGVAVIGVASSLFYSEVAGFVPCVLCWWQRIFLYPQVIVLAVALWQRFRQKESWSAELAAIWLSAAGGLVALYHTYLQFGGVSLGPCAAGPGAVSCSLRYFVEFGYVTIPTMALTAFILIPLILLAARLGSRTR